MPSTLRKNFTSSRLPEPHGLIRGLNLVSFAGGAATRMAALAHLGAIMISTQLQKEYRRHLLTLKILIDNYPDQSTWSDDQHMLAFRSAEYLRHTHIPPCVAREERDRLLHIFGPRKRHGRI
jgi:hypothetical protein